MSGIKQFQVTFDCGRLIPLAAVHVQTLYDGTDSCIPMLDIEGNEFCVD